MYILKNKQTNQFLTREGWTPKDTNLLDLTDALPFTDGEAARNKVPNCEWVRYKFLTWSMFR